MLINYIVGIKYCLVIVLYWIAFYTFGGYVRLTEYLELCSNFICKEMDYVENSFDYIIVGCGSAGSILAQRLAQDKNTTVLVLEAGPSGGKLFDIPAAGPILQLSSIDWQYRTIPQENSSKAFHEQRSNWPMGRIIGGTGRLNNMVYVRGHPSDFREWYKDMKDYNYERDILTYFKKTENHRGTFAIDTKYHSANGPLVVEDLTFETPLASAFLEAVKELGYPVNDLNGKSNSGFMKAQVNTYSGRRWTPAHNLFNHQKSNLKILTNAYVQKVLLRNNYEAYGVEYLYLGDKLRVRASKGVILSAGVIGTPKLLMLSGIGPKKHLTEKGIQTKIDLPVGNNLQDHVTTGFDLVLLNVSLGINIGTVLNPFAGFDYLFQSSGPWTATGAEVVGAVKTNEKICFEHFYNQVAINCMNYTANTYRVKDDVVLQNLKRNSKNVASKYLMRRQKYETFKNASCIDDFNIKHCNKMVQLVTRLRNIQSREESISDGKYNQPDLGFMVIPGGASTDYGGHTKTAAGLTDRTWNKYFVPLMEKYPITILPIVLHPKSKGTIRLSNKDCNSHLEINPNYLTDPHDIKVLLKGVDVIKAIITTKSMQKLGAKLNTQKFPGCETFEFDTKAYWECYVRHLTITSYHPVGTCKMGNFKDKEAVVGYDFRVHGTNKLYVADASVMPTLTSANPNAAVVMIGEKAADEIKYNNFLSLSKCLKMEIFVRKLTSEV